MNKPTLALLAALIAAPVCAHAADAPPSASVKATFGNTLLTIDPDGRSRKIWLKPDGSWTGLSRTGKDLAGKWKMDGEKVCLSQSKPGLPGSLCQVFPAGLKVGGPETQDSSGKTGKLKLLKGHVTK